MTAEPYCDWCGRAIKQAPTLRWFAVKGAERGYPPYECDANTDDGWHEPAAPPAAVSEKAAQQRTVPTTPEQP